MYEAHQEKGIQVGKGMYREERKPNSSSSSREPSPMGRWQYDINMNKEIEMKDCADRGREMREREKARES